MPLTRDADLIVQFAAELYPAIIPMQGDSSAEALAIAEEQLRKPGLRGSILLITDGVLAEQLPQLVAYRKSGGVPVQLLAVSAPPGVTVPPNSPTAPALDRNGQFGVAAAAFARVDSPEAAFNRGNALLMHGKYGEAPASYDRTLQRRPGWHEAETNRALAEARHKLLEPPKDDADGTGCAGHGVAAVAACQGGWPWGISQAPSRAGSGRARRLHRQAHRDRHLYL